ncbi:MULTISPECIES: GNAT family N-acetyltransferase [unclassified Crossiella]|uniref:GNAT family N-acetyltransferase n=1 Tax=unclassified Crossiella TaxID=2620835 RepID=UPI001FFE7396|nr:MULTISPECIES: GNAT family N-acetyltransferase [unclassified Crossiella]MCK2242380.1 GNAT family N-acetyltransferase [Crossiella sp. S99.2]MCK2254589.1 GNAT family N-acetyltransferase [Crossiella sp. S99.1]
MTSGVQPEFRRAVATDVPAIVAMLADDKLGAGRERPGDPAYLTAFQAIDADPNQLLLVAEAGGEVAGTLQLTFIPGLSRLGMSRALIEAVRVSTHQRGGGLGQRMVEFAIAEARRRGCGLVQLTTDASREHAHRFYERLGFVASHVGMKLAL